MIEFAFNSTNPKLGPELELQKIPPYLLSLEGNIIELVRLRSIEVVSFTYFPGLLELQF